MSDPFCHHDEQPRDSSARAVSDGNAGPETRVKNRRIIYRRMGVLAAAIAVPAMAAPGLERAPEPQVIRFVLPQAVPYEPAAEAGSIADDGFAPFEIPAQSARAISANTGPAAHSFAMSGGFTTQLRAEQCLTMAIYYEAASEGVRGQRAVAQVVINRVQHPGFPNSVCGVVFQGSERTTGCQFSFTCDGSTARRPQQSVWNRTKRIARAALGGFVDPNVGLATHYHTLAINPYWAASLKPVADIGAHRFYRWNGSAGQRSAFSANYDGYEESSANYLAGSRRVEIEAPVLDHSETMLANASQTYAASQATVSAATADPTAGPAAPVALAPTASPDANSDASINALPSSGSVLEIHANSGRWLNQP